MNHPSFQEAHPVCGTKFGLPSLRSGAECQQDKGCGSPMMLFRGKVWVCPKCDRVPE